MLKSLGRRVLEGLQTRLSSEAPVSPDAPPASERAPLEVFVDVTMSFGAHCLVMLGWVDAGGEAQFEVRVDEVTARVAVTRGRRTDVDRRFGGAAMERGFAVVASFEQPLAPDVEPFLEVRVEDRVRRLGLVTSPGSGDALLEQLAGYGPSGRDAVLRAITEARGGAAVLATRRARDLRELARPVRGGVDACVVVPGHGIFVAGWLFDPEEAVARVLVRCGRLISDDLLEIGVRRTRPDVTARFGGASSAPGFLAYTPLPVEAHEPTAEVVVMTRDGAIAALPPKPEGDVGAGDRLGAILTEIEPEEPGALERLLGHVAPALEAMWQSRIEGPREATEQLDAVLAAPVTFSVVVALGGTEDAIASQLGALDADPDAARAEILYVVCDPDRAGSTAAHVRRFAPDTGLALRVLAAERVIEPLEALRLGCERARGQYVVLLGACVVPRRSGWMGRLVERLRSERAAVVAPRIWRRDGTLQSAGVFFEPSVAVDGLWVAHRPGSGERPVAPVHRGGRRTPAVDGACLLVTRALLERCGGLDVERPDDLDGGSLCLAAAALGQLTVVDPSEDVVDLSRVRRPDARGARQRWLRALGVSAVRQRAFGDTIEQLYAELGDGRPVAVRRPSEAAPSSGPLAPSGPPEVGSSPRPVVQPPESPGPVEARIERLTPDEISGWVRLREGEELVRLEIEVEGRWAADAVAREPHPDVSGAVRFATGLGKRFEGASGIRAEVRRQGAVAVIAAAVRYDDALVVDVLEQVAHAVRSGTLRLEGVSERLVWQQVVPDLVERVRRDGERSRAAELAPLVTVERTGVTVVVPVYDGLEETRDCLRALAATRGKNLTGFDVLIVDDCGPDPRVRALLAEFAIQPGFEVLVNPENLGFVRSVNAALRRREGRDVVLLNADTVVSGSWVDRLRAAAYHEPAIASVTPLSNDATLCSYPGPEGAPLPPDVTAESMDRLCAEVNAGMRVSIPTGVGFCMYVRGAALREVGLLDETTWGRGYAEENDWCLKAEAVGWAHVAALDVFVQHRGAVSFGSSRKAAAVERNLRLLAERYPEYARTIQVFEARDPLRGGRNRIAIARMREQLARFRHRLLLVSHGLGGGVDAHCDDMERRLAAEGVGVLRAAGRGPWGVELTFGSDRASYQMPDDLDELCADIGRLGVHAVHLHSDLGAVLPLWTLGDRLGLETHVTLHDYTPVCPRVNFTLPDGDYCGEPIDPARCDACIAKFGAHEGVGSRLVELGRSVARWRHDYSARLRAVERVYVPDTDVADRYRRYFPDLPMHVRPHPADPCVVSLAAAASEDALVRVVVVGAIGPHKGLDVLLACAREAELAGRRLHFTVIGYTSDAPAVDELAGVSVSGPYDRDRLPEMLRAEPYDVALLPSRWPETFSYTLSETLRAGIPPVVFDIGAPGRRVQALGVGAVVALGASPTEINDALARVARAERPGTLELADGRYASLMADYYGLIVDP